MQATQKKFKRLSVHPGLCGSDDLRVKKWRPFNCFFSPGTGGRPMGPEPENREGDQDTGSPGRPVSSGLQVPSEPGHYHARARPPW